MAGGQYLNHITAVRLRVTGSGALQSSLLGLDSVETQALTNVTMAATTERYPTLLANFIQQRARYRLEVTGLNEAFLIRQIIIYNKPVASGYPQ